MWHKTRRPEKANARVTVIREHSEGSRKSFFQSIAKVAALALSLIAPLWIYGIYELVSTIAGVGEICGMPTVSWIPPIHWVCQQLEPRLPHITPPPVPGPQTAWITSQTPYFIEVDSSGKYPTILENYLSNDLQLYDPHIVTNVSDAAVILKVGDVSEISQALYSDTALEETPAYDTTPPQSTIGVHLTLQRIDGSRVPFDGDFTCQRTVTPSSPDNNPREVDTLAQKDIAFSIYQYLIGKTDKLTCSP